jgi:hypothetical protein
VPKFGAITLSDVREPTLTIVCPVRIGGRYNVVKPDSRRHDPRPLYLSFASRREAGEVKDASLPEPPQGR